MPVPEETMAKILLLKQQISDEIPNFPVYDNDWYLYYWLRAHGMNVIKTETMLRKSMAWRKEILEPSMSDEEFQLMARELNHETMYSPDGSSCVAFDCVLASNIRKLLTQYGPGLYKSVAETCHRAETFWVKHINSSVLSLESQISYRPRSLNLVDFGLMSVSRVSHPTVVSFIFNVSTIPSTHFPGLLSRTYFINVGTWTRFLANMFIPLFRAPAVETKVYGLNDDEEWKKLLLDHLEPEQIPEYFGGKMSWPISH